MGEINFLSKNNKDGGHKVKDKKGGDNIEWSEPREDDKIKGDEGPSKLSSWFSFYKKNSNKKRDEKISADLSRSRNKILNSTREQPIIKKKKKVSSDNTKEILKIKKGAKKEIKQKQEEQEWVSSDIIETNLIKNEIVSFFDWHQGVKSIIIACVLPCFIVAVIYGLLFLWERKINYKNQNIINQISKVEQQIGEMETIVKDILFFQKRLKLAAKLLDSHVYWTNFFKFLENYTLANVFYDGFQGDTGGNYSLSAKAKDFWTIAQQIKMMRSNNDVSHVSVGGGKSSSKGDDGGSAVDFGLELSIQPSIFIK